MTLGLAVMVGLVGLASWRYYLEWRLGRVELATDGPPLIVQLLPESDDGALGVPFDLVTRSSLAVPAGDYRLRVHGVGRLGRTFRFTVNRGETRTYALSLDEGRLLGREPIMPMGGQEKPREEPIPFAPATSAVVFGSGKADLIERSLRSMIRRDAITGKVVWELKEEPAPPGERRDPETWLSQLISSASHPTLCKLVEPVSDIDGDGTADLTWVFQQQGAVLAISGKDGSILWDYTAALDGPGVSRPAGPVLRAGPGGNQRAEPGARWCRVIDSPAMADVDGDGTPDVIATITFSESEEEITRRTGLPPEQNGVPRRINPLYRRVVVAISGRSGRDLWKTPLDEAFAALPTSAWEGPVRVVRARGSVVLTFLDGDRRIMLDAATGRPRARVDELGFTPVRPVQHVDFDGDGEPDILALGAGQAAGEQTLSAFSGASGRALWTEPVRAKYEPLFDVMGPPGWPLVADLDGDGRPEVAVPDSGPMPPGPGYRGLRLLDGMTGRGRWVRPMRPETSGGDGLLEILDAPDLDGDGVRDLIATSFFLGRSPTSPNEGTPPIPERVYVDALSGRDGHPLWSWHSDHPSDKVAQVQPVRWWGRGPDGWPLLAVGLGGHLPSGGFNAGLAMPPIVHNLEASTGRDVATAVGLGSPGVADLDGDGLLDLWGKAGGQLQAFRGEAPEAWRALGKFSPAQAYGYWPSSLVAPMAADLDGDGIADALSADIRAPAHSARDAIGSRLLEPAFARGFPAEEVPAWSPPPGSRTAVARSGLDGRVIWKALIDEPGAGFAADRGDMYALTAYPLPGGDFDGDGTADVIVQKSGYGNQPGGFELKEVATLPLQVRSGRSGRRLWSAGPLPLGFRAFGASTVVWSRPLIVTPGEAPDLLVCHASPFDPKAPPSPPAGSPTKPHLARVSGRTGRLLWDIVLGEQSLQAGWGSPPFPSFGDLDGDGSLEAVMILVDPAGSGGISYGLRAVSLRDGRLLWTHGLDFRPSPIDTPELAVVDLDGDRRSEVVVSERPNAGGNTGYALKVLEGRDAQDRWTWRAEPDGPERLYRRFFLADLDGDGRRSIGLSFSGPVADAQGVRRIVVLDPQGQVRADRDLTGPLDNAVKGNGSTFTLASDLTGDGRDEILFFSRRQLHAWGPDLKELWARSEEYNHVERIVPATARQPAALVIDHPMLAIDGADGHPRWAGSSPHAYWGFFKPQVLDPGSPTRPAFLISQSLDATTCRRAIPTDSQGAYEPPRGSPTPTGLTRDDPRWTRPLPWVELAVRDDVRTAVLASTVLAVLNVGLPLALLRLLTGRRLRSLRLVMALPAASAIPLIAFVTLEPSIPALPAPFPSSPGMLFLLGSLAGVPILAYPVLAGWALVRCRWRFLGWLVGLTVMASLGVGVGWVWWDRRTMPPIEHYDWAGWQWALASGACVAGLLMLVGWSARGAIRLLDRRGTATGDQGVRPS